MSQVTDYSIAQKVVHWVMAFLICMDLFIAQKFGDVMEELDRLESRVDHGSLGTIVAFLFLLRLYLRYKNGAPPLPVAMPHWQVVAAKWGHSLLYLLIGFLILSGIITAMNATAPIALFGQFEITFYLAQGQASEQTFAFLRGFHEFATNAVIALILIHIAAAAYHLLIVKDQSTQRMLRFWKQIND